MKRAIIFIVAFAVAALITVASQAEIRGDRECPASQLIQPK